MRIGIIGAGSIGQTVGRLLAEAGHELVVSWASNPNGAANSRTAPYYGDEFHLSDLPALRRL